MVEYGAWLIAAGLIIMVLAVIAGRLLWQLRGQRQREQSERAEFQQETALQGQTARQGISILVRSYLAGQVGASECALRVAVLSETAAIESTLSEDVAVFCQMAAALAHIPTHGDWKALSPEQRASYSAEMGLLEARYLDSLQRAAERLSTIG
ncbi:DUF2489 domain-containing protein [Zhongshania sp.]|uniref:DUF2489 domain-containing protein n=1 Tax=Zhongshania sp. TaxID=1971902 RepID=UPI00356B38BF